jgi:hypothetical protein
MYILVLVVIIPLFLRLLDSFLKISHLAKLFPNFQVRVFGMSSLGLGY